MEELETTLGAIARGEIDALVIAHPTGPQVFTLQGADQPYRVLVENMSEGALALLPDGTISYANRRFAQSVKYTLDEVIGIRFENFLSGPDAGAFERLMASGGVARELTLVARDQSRVPVQISVQPMETAGGPLLAVVVTDLSDVWRNRELLATVINNVPNLLLAAWDSTGIYTMSAGLELQVLGRSPNYLVGSSLLRTNAWPAERIIEGRRRVLAGEQVSDTMHLKGRTLDVWMTPIKNATGAVIGGVMGAADVTERVRIERELERRVAQQSAVAAFGQRALEGLEPQALAREATEVVRRILNVDRCSLLELQADGEHLRVNAGTLEKYGQAPRIFPLKEFPQARQVLTTLQPSVEDDFAASGHFESAWATRHGVRSGLVVPISGRQRPYGTLGAYTTTQRNFSSDDLNFVSAIATLFAQALHRHEADVESRQREEFYRSLTENLSEAVAVIRPDGILEYAGDSTERVLGYKPADVIGTSAFWYLPPNQAQWLRASLAKALHNP
ncbi:MAG TPA: PAS domain S-box protein, partial [Candidatus Binataceae bacterium]|nr:PAS domain S-box protein [Candidatus Binataceae bacterium]